MRKTSTAIIFVLAFFLLAVGYNYRHVMTAPKCVEVVEANRVVVEDAGSPMGIGAKCDAEEIRAYLVRYDFEKVGSRGIGFDYVYAR